MSESFDIIFRGDILPGHTLPDVKARMAQLFKLDDAKLATVFSGRPVALKKQCDAAMAEKLKAVLTKAGAEIEVKSNTPAPKAASPTSPAAAAPEQSQPAPPSETPTPPPAPEPASPSPATATPGEISLAPQSGFLVAPEEHKHAEPVQVETDHIKLEGRKASFLLPDDEPGEVSEKPEIDAPEFGLFEAGADLLNDEEKREFVELELDLSNIDLAEVGADVLREEERETVIPVAVADLEADLAPAGSDMGEIKKAPPPPPPDTDHIDLA